MRCPPEITTIISSLLTTGLLRIRSHGWSGRADRCAIEADHIHNLPALLDDYSPELLSFYWNVERPSYISQVPEAELGGWKVHWQELQPFAEAACSTASTL